MEKKEKYNVMMVIKLTFLIRFLCCQVAVSKETEQKDANKLVFDVDFM